MNTTKEPSCLDGLDARNTHRIICISTIKRHAPVFYTNQAAAFKAAKSSLFIGDTLVFKAVEVQARIKNNRWKTIKTFRGIGKDTLDTIERAGAPRKVWQVQGTM